MKLEDEHLNYAKKLDELGDETNNISNRVPIMSDSSSNDKSKEHLINHLNDLKKASRDYSLLIEKLFKMNVPAIVLDEHNQLISGYSCFVHGNNLMSDSININEQAINDVRLSQGRAINQIGESTVQKATERISDILTKHLA